MIWDFNTTGAEDIIKRAHLHSKCFRCTDVLRHGWKNEREDIMQIRINVRGASRKKASIIQKTAVYPDRSMTVEEFLAETVRQNVREYNERKDQGTILRLFSGSQQGETIEDVLENKAQTGKVAYGDPMDDRKADAEKAVKNALQCFDDGLVALFADGIRYRQRTEMIPLKEQSEVTFVRLTFLAGRMW